jgi:DNA-binding response OmpR family regulator
LSRIESTKAPADPAAKGEPKVLLVDDDPEYGHLTVRRLRHAGLRVDFHLGAFGATAVISRGKYDLVLLDVNMPGLSGPGLVEALQKNGVPIRVVFYSSADGLGELAATCGAAGYVSKGAPIEELTQRIQTLLAS